MSRTVRTGTLNELEHPASSGDPRCRKVELPEHLKKNQLKQQSEKKQATKLYEAKEAEFPEAEQLRELERVIVLKVVDRKWMDHIDDMEQLRQGIGLQAYGQKDPLVEYKMSALRDVRCHDSFHSGRYPPSSATTYVWSRRQNVKRLPR